MKKKLNVLLIFVVVFVWGLILYRVARRYFLPEHQADQITHFKKVRSSAMRGKDTFIFKPLPRDPFLGTVAKGSAAPRMVVRRAGSKLVASKPITPTQWPPIKYYGFIKSKGKKTELVLLKVNNQLRRLRPGDAVENVLLTKVFKDSIAVAFNKERRIIHLEK
jgi:hypothetical protein